MKKSIKPGKIIIPAGTLPETHELETANVLAGMGYDVEFLCPSGIKGSFSPDILCGGQRWEMKCPCGNSRHTLEKHFRKAEKQSKNIIFDLRRIGMDEAAAIAQIKRGFLLKGSHGKVKCILIITKDNKILDFTR
jgi:hypothetical protein